jgi:hypothetical protein
MRRSFVFFTLASFAAACGINETGLLDILDSSTIDGTLPDVSADNVVQDAGPDVTGFDVVPLSCEEAGTPLDASCLGQTVPPGWQPIAYRENATGCGSLPNFTELDGITDASVPSGQCFCSDCKVVGGWSCAATLYTGPTCPQNSQTFDASACYTQGGFHYGGTVARFGDAGCNPGSEVDASVAATQAALCTPTSCSADFCGLVGKGYLGCIVATTADAGACPGGFNVARQIGPSATASCTCPACSLTNGSASCGGTLTAYPNNVGNCSGTGIATQALDGGCVNLTAGYGSVYYEASAPPQPACQSTSPATGTATLDSPTTVCCTQ